MTEEGCICGHLVPEPPAARGSGSWGGTAPSSTRGTGASGSCPPGPPCTLGTAVQVQSWPWVQALPLLPSRPASAQGAEQGLGSHGGGAASQGRGNYGSALWTVWTPAQRPRCSRPHQPFPAPCARLRQPESNAHSLAHHVPGAYSTPFPSHAPEACVWFHPPPCSENPLGTHFPATEAGTCCLWDSQVAPRSQTPGVHAPYDPHPQVGGSVNMMDTLHIWPR